MPMPVDVSYTRSAGSLSLSETAHRRCTGAPYVDPSIARQVGRRTDISSLDHGHVIPAVADTAHRLSCEAPNQQSDIGFLSWRAAACYDCRQLGSEKDELFAELVEADLYCELKSLPA
jgi:hypothetical protein